MKRLAKQGSALLLAALLSISLLAGCGQQTGTASAAASSAGASGSAAAETTKVSVAALKGPTAMGMVKLMSDAEAGPVDGNDYTFTIAASPDEISPQLAQGALDIACVPANLAAVLYQKMEGEVRVLAVNTLGVLYIVEKGDTVHSFADLKGKTICAAGKGSTPEYAMRYLLQKNGLDPDRDVNIVWKSEHAECVTALASGEETIALLPQPFVTTAEMKDTSIRTALDLNAAWDALGEKSSLITGAVIARQDFIDQHADAVNRFLTQYAASVDYVNTNTADAAKLIEGYDIVPAAVAEKALPDCHIVCITGKDMQEKLSGYLQTLYDQNPAAVGGALPDDAFYYGA